MSLVQPKHVPKPNELGCRSLVPTTDFDGTLIGYGYTNFHESVFGTELVPHRNFNTSTGWGLVLESIGGDRYSNYWDILPDPAFTSWWYNGILNGDSGGALLGGPSDVLCGVISRFFPATGGPPFFQSQIGSDATAIDSTQSLEFLHSRILDSKGRFWGECDEDPVAGRDIDTDQDLIPDSCDACPNVPARDATGRNTYDHSVDPDTDGDGVPDACDNCPLKPNPYITSLHVQPDDDGDGVGNACDSCDGAFLPSKNCCTTDADCGPDNDCILGPGSHIISFPICSAGRCAKPIDRDQDLVGDSCDNCPPDPQGNFGVSNTSQADTDMDGVGDACDNCPGLPNETHVEDQNPLCGAGGDAFCKTLFHESVCVPPDFVNGIQSAARCSKGIDSDGDKVGNACDNCPNRDNPFEGLGFQPNCNRDVEVLLNNPPYPFAGEGDACDEDPCSELGFSYPPDGLTPPPPNETWVKIAYTPNLLPGALFADAYAYPFGTIPKATVGVRNCPCEVLDSTISDFTPLNCHTKGVCPINSNQYMNSFSNWKPVNIRASAALQDPVPPGPWTFAMNAELVGLDLVDPVPPPHVPAAGFKPVGSATKHADWQVGEVFFAKSSIMWSHVPSVTELFVIPSTYAPRSNHYETGRFGPKPQQASQPDFVTLDVCHILDICPECPILIDTPNWVHDPATLRVFARGTAHEVEMTARAAPDVLIGLGEPNVEWVPVAEQESWLRREDARLAAITPDGTGVHIVIADRDGILTSVLTGVVGLSTSTDEPSPPPRSQFGALLSGMENALFVMGGLNPNNQPTGDVWSFDLSKAKWFSLPITGTAPNKVLAATFRPQDRSLYVFDELDGVQPPQARLLKIDLGNLESSVLGSWKRKNNADRIFLSNAPRGELLLVGTSTNHHYDGVVLRLHDDGVIEETIGVKGDGHIVLEPTLTDRGVTLPLQVNGAVRNTFVPREEMDDNGAPKIKDCL